MCVWFDSMRLWVLSVIEYSKTHRVINSIKCYLNNDTHAKKLNRIIRSEFEHREWARKNNILISIRIHCTHICSLQTADWSCWLRDFSLHTKQFKRNWSGSATKKNSELHTQIHYVYHKLSYNKIRIISIQITVKWIAIQ